MKYLAKFAMAVVALAMVGGSALAATDAETVALFKKAGQSSTYFSKSYGYAVFPTVGKGGIGIGGAYRQGQRLPGWQVHGRRVADPAECGLPAGR